MASQGPQMRPPAAPVTGWEVKSQQETTAPGPDGKLTSGIEVSFTTGKGQKGTVFLPRAMYTTQNVIAAIAAHAAMLDTIIDLKG